MLRILTCSFSNCIIFLKKSTEKGRLSCRLKEWVNVSSHNDRRPFTAYKHDYITRLCFHNSFNKNSAPVSGTAGPDGVIPMPQLRVTDPLPPLNSFPHTFSVLLLFVCLFCFYNMFLCVALFGLYAVARFRWSPGVTGMFYRMRLHTSALNNSCYGAASLQRKADSPTLSDGIQHWNYSVHQLCKTQSLNDVIG